MLSRLRSFLACLLLVLAFVPTNVHAAALTDRSDRMERQDTSQSSNHELRFTTPTGVDANTDTITVTFAAGFNLASLTATGVDLLHGPVTGLETNEVVAASAAAGVWGASISGQTVTLTAPTNAAAGEIAASDLVVIRLGTNAGGVNRISNPSASNVYQINFGGTFGDSGNLYVAINDNTAIGVSATVPATSTPATPGGGGNNGGGDTVPPVISNLRVINITTSTADVLWSTNETATSRVDYGVSIPYSNFIIDPTLVGSHSIRLVNLLPDTLYHFMVYSADSAGNLAYSTDRTFRTAAIPAAPVLSNIRAINITAGSASIAWDTNIPGTSIVNFGLSASYDATSTVAGYATSHTVPLTGLSPNTIYHYRVTSSESSQNLTSTSGDFTFTTTGDTTPPTNVFNLSATPALRSVNLSWQNPPDVDFSFTRLVARTDGNPINANDGRIVYQGAGTSAVDTGLEPGVRVYYAAYAVDTVGNVASGAYADAVPFGDPVVPPTEPPTEPPVTPPTGPGGGTPTTTPPVRPPVRPPVTPTAPSTSTPPVVEPPAAPTTSTPPIITPPVVEPPPVTTSTQPTPTAPRITAEYVGASGNVPLQPDNRGAIGALPSQPILVRVPVSGLPTPTKGTIRVGNNAYALTPLPEKGFWGASFIAGQQVGNVAASVLFTFANGTEAKTDNTIAIQSLGRTYEQVGQEKKGVESATLKISIMRGTQEEPYRATSNDAPLLSGKEGVYGLVVPNGRYRIRAEKTGFYPGYKEVIVTNNVLATDILLEREPSITNILAVIQAPEVKQAATIAVPVAAVATAAIAASAISGFSLLSYIYFLLTQPFLLIGRRRRNKWGVVYNSLSKLPIELAVVRLVHADTKRVVQTRITDSKGRYSFLVKPGRYRIEVVKPGFKFASELLRGEKLDVDFVDLYFGDTIEVKEETLLTVNIPLDPIAKEQEPRKVLLKRFFRKFQSIVGVISVVVSAVALIIAPSWLLAGLFVSQVIIYLLFRRLAIPPKPKEWGYVHDIKNKKQTLDVAVVRIFDKKFNKVLETQVTNKSGKYAFIVGRNQYYITAQREGYEPYRSPDMDFTNPGEHVVDQPIPLTKKLS